MPVGLYDGDDQVTAIHCNGRDGFFVPSIRYRALSAADELIDDLATENHLLEEQNTELTEANLALARTASSAIERADVLEEAFERLDRPWYDHPVLVVTVAFLGAVAVVLAAGGE